MDNVVTSHTLLLVYMNFPTNTNRMGKEKKTHYTSHNLKIIKNFSHPFYPHATKTEQNVNNNKYAKRRKILLNFKRIRK